MRSRFLRYAAVFAVLAGTSGIAAHAKADGDTSYYFWKYSPFGWAHRQVFGTRVYGPPPAGYIYAPPAGYQYYGAPTITYAAPPAVYTTPSLQPAPSAPLYQTAPCQTLSPACCTQPAGVGCACAPSVVSGPSTQSAPAK